MEPGKPGDLNLISRGQEIAWNFSHKRGQSKKFSIKPGMLRYTKFQYYIQVLDCCKFRMPLVSAFWCQNCVPSNLENDLLDLDKTWR